MHTSEVTSQLRLTLLERLAQADAHIYEARISSKVSSRPHQCGCVHPLSPGLCMLFLSVSFDCDSRATLVLSRQAAAQRNVRSRATGRQRCSACPR